MLFSSYGHPEVAMFSINLTFSRKQKFVLPGEAENLKSPPVSFSPSFVNDSGLQGPSPACGETSLPLAKGILHVLLFYTSSGGTALPLAQISPSRHWQTSKGGACVKHICTCTLSSLLPEWLDTALGCSWVLPSAGMTQRSSGCGYFYGFLGEEAKQSSDDQKWREINSRKAYSFLGSHHPRGSQKSQCFVFFLRGAFLLAGLQDQLPDLSPVQGARKLVMKPNHFLTVPCSSSWADTGQGAWDGLEGTMLTTNREAGENVPFPLLRITSKNYSLSSFLFQHQNK